MFFSFLRNQKREETKLSTKKPGPSKAQSFLSDLCFTTFVERIWENWAFRDVQRYVIAKVLGISKSERVVSTHVCDDVMHSGPKTVRVRSICALMAYGENG